MYFCNNIEFTMWVRDLERLDKVLTFLRGEQGVVLEQKPFQLAAGGGDGFSSFRIRELFVIHVVQEMVSEGTFDVCLTFHDDRSEVFVRV